MSHEIAPDPGWFQRAVFYEMLVQAGFDSDGDGVGDLRGLTTKLDYLQWLGVDCLWLPPFYDSPGRDGGYDVRDFYRVSPAYGTVEDFTALVAAAHARGIRVITDLVLNHTSDQHAWFQASRSDPDGPYGDFYVWSDTDTGYAGVRVIFSDTEKSNWTWDETRGQFYWHRFYGHQPDLNYDNPAVGDAMLDVIRFWLDLGIDGFRLDAATYLFEREGTDCANLPETHAYLKRVRREIDARYPGAILLAEANLGPAELVDYFGDPQAGGDECHMAFHFPLMPRIFMAVRQESRRPVADIMARTPPVPAGCQWGTFLRNHDELTLEMVTEEERDYMYDAYAPDPRTRLNAGIRRRLAPLLDNDRTRIQLVTAMLLSLPGAPVLYYGDEIGMGDDVTLDDRDGVRTPMQWSAGPQGGFSTAADLYPPANRDEIFGYAAVNVAGQMVQPASLLRWTRDLIAVRKRHPALAVGDFTDLGGDNPRVFSYVREHGDDAILCVLNLSARPQPVALDLGARYHRRVPVELTGAEAFPAVGRRPYPLTLPGHGFYWFHLRPASRTRRPAVTAFQHPAEPRVPALDR